MCVCAVIFLLLALLLSVVKPTSFYNRLISSLVVTQQYKPEVALVKVRQISLPYETGSSKMASASWYAKILMFSISLLKLTIAY